MTSTSKWQAVAKSAEIGSKPKRVTIDGQPVALFRSDGAVRGLLDRCPHRFAPLSAGRLVGGLLECPYHGWRFDGSGRCHAIPGLTSDLPHYAVPAYAITETGGLVFASREPSPGKPYFGVLSGPGVVSTIVESRVKSTLLDVAENILDATHTHFTHQRILRGLSTKRYRVNVTVTGGDGWVEARYSGETKQEGLISRMLEGERSISVGRFMAPGIAELEFWGRDKINLATTFHLRQETPDTVHGFGILSGPRQRGLGYIKAALFKPFFKIALRQDQDILHAVTDNKRATAATRPLMTELDVLRPHIDTILRGDCPTVATGPVHMVMEL